MADKRRTLSPEFKAKIALEAIRGEKTINELAKEHQVHPGQITQWKKDLLAGAADIFSGKAALRKAEDEQKKTEEFYLESYRVHRRLYFLSGDSHEAEESVYQGSPGSLS